MHRQLPRIWVAPHGNIVAQDDSGGITPRRKMITHQGGQSGRGGELPRRHHKNKAKINSQKLPLMRLSLRVPWAQSEVEASYI